MGKRMPLVLVVDDDPEILDLVSVTLGLEGYRVVVTEDPGKVEQLVRDEQPELVLLDIMMPVTDGFKVCQRIRQFSQVPVIMLSAKGQVEDIVRGLDLGADDYVVKPFGANELEARVRAVLNRTKICRETPKATFASGGLVIDFAEQMVKIGDREVVLSNIECRLLSLLARNPGKVITYGHLLSEVWGPEYYGEDNHILEAAVGRLRKRLADGSGKHDYIGTRRGIGYFFNAPNEESPSDTREGRA